MSSWYLHFSFAQGDKNLKWIYYKHKISPLLWIFSFVLSSRKDNFYFCTLNNLLALSEFGCSAKFVSMKTCILMLRYAMLLHILLVFSLSICCSYCCLAWQISILQFHELNQKPSLCRVNHHMYELYVVGQKIRLSSTPLKPAEPTPRSA